MAERTVLAHTGSTCSGINLPFYNLQGLQSLTALDISTGMLDQAQAKAQMMAYSQNVQFVVGDVQSLPFGESTFDSVVDTFSLCVYPDPQQALREMARVLKPGASFPRLLARPVAGSPTFRVRFAVFAVSSHYVAGPGQASGWRCTAWFSDRHRDRACRWDSAAARAFSQQKPSPGLVPRCHI